MGIPKLRTYNYKGPREKVKKCTVCNELKLSKSVAHNYGVQCCSGCKSFFRRVCRGEKTVKPCVSRNAACQCDQCRFNKCLARGMDRNYLREDNAVGGARRSVTPKRTNCIKRKRSKTAETNDIPIPSNNFPEHHAGETSGFPPANNTLQGNTFDITNTNEQCQLHHERRSLPNSHLHGKSQEVEYQRKQSKELDRMTNEVKKSELRRKKKKLNDLCKKIDNFRKLRVNKPKNKENELENFNETDAENEFLDQRGQNQELNNLHNEIDDLRIVKQTAEELNKLHKAIDGLSKLKHNESKKIEQERHDFDKRKANAEKEFQDSYRKRSEEMKNLQLEIDNLKKLKAAELEQQQKEFYKQKADNEKEFHDIQRKQSEELKNLQQEIDDLRALQATELEKRKEELHDYRKEIDDLIKLKQHERKKGEEELLTLNDKKKALASEIIDLQKIKRQAPNKLCEHVKQVTQTKTKKAKEELGLLRNRINDLRQLKETESKMKKELDSFNKMEVATKNGLIIVQRKLNALIDQYNRLTKGKGYFESHPDKLDHDYSKSRSETTPGQIMFCDSLNLIEKSHDLQNETSNDCHVPCNRLFGKNVHEIIS